MKCGITLVLTVMLMMGIVTAKNGETPASYLYESSRTAWIDAYSFGMGGVSVAFGNGPVNFGNYSSYAFSPYLQIGGGMSMLYKIKGTSEYSASAMYGAIAHPIRDWFVFSLTGGQMSVYAPYDPLTITSPKTADNTVMMIAGTFSRVVEFEKVQFAFGLTGKYASQTIKDGYLGEDGSGFGGDASMLIKIPVDANNNTFNIGASFTDILAPMNVAMGTAVGAGLEFRHELFGGAKLNIGGDYVMNYTDNTMMRFGAEEWFYNNMVALKAGYMSHKSGDTETNIITTGLSVAYAGFVGSFGYGIGGNDIEDSMTFEIGYNGVRQPQKIQQKIAPKIQLLVNNDVFSPNGDGQRDQTRFRIESTDGAVIKHWTLTIADENNKPVKVFSGKNAVPAFITWDGRDMKDKKLPDGAYSASIEVVDKFKNKSISNSLKVMIKTTGPSINLSIIPEVFKVGGDPVKFVVTLLEPSEVRTTKITISTAEGVLHTITFNGIKDAFEWNGILDNGTYVAEGQILSVQADVTDKADNTAQSATVSMPVEKYIAPEIEETPVTDTPKVTALPPVYLSSRIRFAENSFSLSAATKEELNKTIELLKQNPSSKVRVEGHTDNVGAASVNYKLSRQRADVVKNYIIKEGGIDQSRVASVGYGPDMPIDSNTTVQGRANNRRVDVIILSY